ncbi:hypothetical protein Tco_1413881, partial [Tanacetum coccineum]
ANFSLNNQETKVEDEKSKPPVLLDVKETKGGYEYFFFGDIHGGIPDMSEDLLAVEVCSGGEMEVTWRGHGGE